MQIFPATVTTLEKAFGGDKNPTGEEAAAAPSRRGLFGGKKSRDDLYEGVVLKKSKWFVLTLYFLFFSCCDAFSHSE